MTLYFKILKILSVYVFLSIVIVVLVKVKTSDKQFVLSTRNQQGWRRGEKIHQLSVTTVSCVKVAASLNLLHHSRDLPFIQLREDPVAPIARADSELKCDSNSASVSCVCFVEPQAAVRVFLCLLQEVFPLYHQLQKSMKCYSPVPEMLRVKQWLKDMLTLNITEHKEEGPATFCSRGMELGCNAGDPL